MAATELSYGKLKKWLLGKGCAVSEVGNCPDKAHLLILMQKKGIEVTLASAELPITAVLLEVVSFYWFFCSESHSAVCRWYRTTHQQTPVPTLRNHRLTCRLNQI